MSLNANLYRDIDRGPRSHTATEVRDGASKSAGYSYAVTALSLVVLGSLYATEKIWEATEGSMDWEAKLALEVTEVLTVTTVIASAAWGTLSGIVGAGAHAVVKCVPHCNPDDPSYLA